MSVNGSPILLSFVSLVAVNLGYKNGGAEGAAVKIGEDVTV